MVEVWINEFVTMIWVRNLLHAVSDRKVPRQSNNPVFPYSASIRTLFVQAQVTVDPDHSVIIRYPKILAGKGRRKLFFQGLENLCFNLRAYICRHIFER